MSDRIGIAKLSFAHVHAAGYAEEVRRNPDAELVAVWDEDPVRGQIEAEKRGLPFYADLDAVLALESVQGVVVDAPTNLHPMVMIAAARAGKHIFTEKALTITIQEADEVVAAVKQSGVKFMFSLPSPLAQWISAIKHDTPMTIDLQDGWNLTQLMEGCYTAARTGQAYVF